MIPPTLLAHVPGNHPRVTLLPGGRANRVYRIDTTAGSFALRLRTTQDDPPGVDRLREALVQAAAAAVELAPRVISCATQEGWLLMEFIAGECWTPAQFAQPEALCKLGSRLAKLHALPAAPGAVFDAQAIARRQIARIRNASPDAPDFSALLVALAQLELQLDKLRRQVVMNHGDLDAANLLGAAPMLIDWEYSQLADPVYDIACLLTYYPAARPHAAVLLEAAGLDDPVSAQRLPLQLQQFYLLNQLWRQAQQLCGQVSPAPAKCTVAHGEIEGRD